MFPRPHLTQRIEELCMKWLSQETVTIRIDPKSNNFHKYWFWLHFIALDPGLGMQARILKPSSPLHCPNKYIIEYSNCKMPEKLTLF